MSVFPEREGNSSRRVIVKYSYYTDRELRPSTSLLGGGNQKNAQVENIDIEDLEITPTEWTFGKNIFRIIAKNHHLRQDSNLKSSDYRRHSALFRSQTPYH